MTIPMRKPKKNKTPLFNVFLHLMISEPKHHEGFKLVRIDIELEVELFHPASSHEIAKLINVHTDEWAMKFDFKYYQRRKELDGGWIHWCLSVDPHPKHRIFANHWIVDKELHSIRESKPFFSAYRLSTNIYTLYHYDSI